MTITNHPYRLDTEFLRRFNKLIHVPLPDETARQKMFKHFCAVQGFSDEDFITWAQKTKKKIRALTLNEFSLKQSKCQ